jgi:hypothetical protein
MTSKPGSATAATYETQNKRGFLECPACGSSHVSKALMAPNVATRASAKRSPSQRRQCRVQREIMSKLQAMAREVRKTGEDVGTRFPGGSPQDPLWRDGRARHLWQGDSPEEVTKLLDEGVEIMPLPDLPEDMN